jgi:hypothetical protein
MSFFKKLFESKPLSLNDLIELNAVDGMYNGEILNELKSKILFIALPEPPARPVDFDDPTTQYMILTQYGINGFLVPVFLDQRSLSQRDDKAIPHMIEFRTIAKFLENQNCRGILFCTRKFDVVYTRQDLSRVLPLGQVKKRVNGAT